MSQSCPLCGSAKPEEALFCDDCTRKIHSEYEVDIPERIKKEDTASALEVEVVESDVKGEKPKERGMESDVDAGPEEEEVQVELDAKRKKRMATPLLLVLMFAFLVGAFFVYNGTIRKNNLDRSGWDAAVKTNSVEGYLAYMQAHPKGVHFDEAQEGLRRLKSEEASTWERMKETDNVTELRDFLERHSGSPYAPLVKTRLDSLVWIGTLRTNTPESYSDYIMLTESGGIKGEYIAEARKRYELLFSSNSADAAVQDSIRTTVDGFFVSLSSLDHNGMFRFLAPMVYRFFDSGTSTRERITGELLVTGARTEGPTLKFIPDLQSVSYEVTNNNHYKVNIPLQKSYQKGGATERVHGYIAHIELDPLYQIVSIFETKPYPEAP